MTAAADPTSTTEEDLARQARGGSVAAFDELARRVQPPLVAFLTRRFGSREDAEDAAQEALVRAWGALHTYRDGTRFRTWLFTIAYRAAVSAARGRKPGTAANTLQWDTADPSPSAADTLEAAESRDRIWTTARSLLNDEQALALWLYYVEELPAGQVARVLGRSWVSVKTMMHRARKKLEPHLLGEVDRTPAQAVRAGEPS